MKLKSTPGTDWILLLFLAVVQAGGLALPHLGSDPAQQATLTLLAYLVSGLSYAGLLVWVWLVPLAARPGRGALLFLLVAGAAFRAILFPLDPALSQDVQRFRWEGLVQQAGFNPFIHPPDDPQLADLAAAHPDLYARLEAPHRPIPTIYPPTTQLLFRLNAALFDASLWGWKLILLAFDLLLVAAVALLLRVEQRPLIGLAALWWCPLLLIETYEGGHIDLIGVSLLAIAILAAVRNLWPLAAVTIALAVNVKYLWPALGAIVLLRTLPTWRSRILFTVTTAALVALLWIPFADGFSRGLETAGMFAAEWHFNDYVLGQVRELYPPKSLQPIRIALGLSILAAAALALVGPRRPNADVWLVAGFALLLSPVVFPWYLIWIVPALARGPALWVALWVITVPAVHFTHARYVASGFWDDLPQLSALVTLGPLFLLIVAWLARLLVHPFLATPQTPCEEKVTPHA